MDTMTLGPTTIDDLPSEILIQVLTPLSTLELLPLARINHRFHDLAQRIIHNRLACIAALPEHELILECYHPSAKISTPYLHCDYLGTDGLKQGEENQLGFGELRNLYSRFKPVVQEENRRSRRRWPRMSMLGESSSPKQVVDEEPEAPCHDVYLDDGEVFSQLCTVTNLVKVGPKRGLFLSHVNVNDGVVRVFRKWLAAAAARESSGEGALDTDDMEQILWTDRHHNVGLKFRVREIGDIHRPVLVDSDEDLPVSYRMEYQELLVRTNQLLLHAEESQDQEVTHTDDGYVLQPGSKIPCQAQVFCWMESPENKLHQRQWGETAPIWVGGA